MTEAHTSSYSRLRKSNQFLSRQTEELNNMADERGGSISALENQRNRSVSHLSDQNLALQEYEQFDRNNQYGQRFEFESEDNENGDIDQNQTANGREKEEIIMNQNHSTNQLIEVDDQDDDKMFILHENNKSNQNFTIIDYNEPQSRDLPQQDNLGTDFDIEQIEISFDDETYHINSKKSPPIRNKQSLVPDRAFSNLDDPIHFTDVDEGTRNDEFNKKTPLREPANLLMHNKFQKENGDQLPIGNSRGYELNRDNDAKILDFKMNEEPQQSERQNEDNQNIFDTNGFLDQDEIDKILQENNISPLKNQDNDAEERKIGEYEELEYALNNSGSDFEVDYIDDDNIFVNNRDKVNKIINYEPQFMNVDNVDLLGQGSNFEHLDKLAGISQHNIQAHLDDKIMEEMFHDFDNKRQVTHESKQLDSKNIINIDRQDIKRMEKSSRKQTSSAMGVINSGNQSKIEKRQNVPHHSSKKSQITNYSSKDKFQDYYQTNPVSTKNARDKIKNVSSNSIVKQTSISSSHDSRKGKTIFASDQVGGSTPNIMKLDILKRKMNQMKNGSQQVNKTIEKEKQSQFKFQRLKLPDMNSDSNSGDDKLVPTEIDSTGENQNGANKLIRKFNEIQSKSFLDSKTSPYTQIINSKKTQLTLDDKPTEASLNQQSYNSMSPLKNLKQLAIKQREQQKQSLNRDLKDQKPNLSNKLTNKSLNYSSIQVIKPQPLNDPYERYKKQLIKEQKLQGVPTISLEQAIPIQKLSKPLSDISKFKNGYEKSLEVLKQYSSQPQIQAIQNRGQIKSIRLLDKQALESMNFNTAHYQSTKEDSKLIKELQILENKEKTLKQQIERIQTQLEKRKKDEEVQKIEVKCLYKSKLENLRQNEKANQPQFQSNQDAHASIREKNARILSAQIINQDKANKGHSKRQSFGSQKIKDDPQVSIEQEVRNSFAQLSKTPIASQPQFKDNDQAGYQQLNKMNCQKIGINANTQSNQNSISKFSQQSQTPASVSTPKIKSKGITQVSIKQIKIVPQDQIKRQEDLEERKSGRINLNAKDNHQSPDVSPGYYYVSKKSAKNRTNPENSMQPSFNNKIIDQREEIKKQSEKIPDTDNESSLMKELIKKKNYRPLTAVQKPIAISQEILKLYQERQTIENKDSITENFNHQDQSSSISSNKIVDLNMVAKANETKYTRDQLIRMKDKMKSISPLKRDLMKSGLPPIQEDLAPNYSLTNKDNTKRVSFKDSSLSEISSQAAHITNFRYNKDVVDSHLKNSNIVNRKSFEQTFNPKTDGQPHYSGNGVPTQNRHTRNQSILQSYHEQAMTSKRSNQEQLKVDETRANEVGSNDKAQKKPQVSNKYINSMIENQKKASSILKSSTIDAPPNKERVNYPACQRANNHTLNETLKIKIQKEEEFSREVINPRDETMQTMRSRENRSLDKSGIDFMTEARDFQNIISNLKTLLHKGKQVTIPHHQISLQNQTSIDPRPSSKASSINNSYITQVNHANFRQQHNGSMIQQHSQQIERNYFASQKRSISSQGAYNQLAQNSNLNNEYGKIHQNNFDSQSLNDREDISSKQETRNHQENKSRLSNQNGYEEKRKREFDLKIQRDIKALENILQRKHQLMKLNNDSNMNMSISQTGVHHRSSSFNQSRIENQRHSIISSRSTSVQRLSTQSNQIGAMTFGQNSKQKNINPRGQSFSHSRKSIGLIGNFAPLESAGTLLQSIQEAEEQLQILKGDSSSIEKQIKDLRLLRNGNK